MQMIHNRILVLLLNYVHINTVVIEQFFLEILELDFCTQLFLLCCLPVTRMPFMPAIYTSCLYH